MHHLNTAALLLAAHLTGHTDRLRTGWLRRRARSRHDRGSSVVETIIIVAGFAGLAFTIYLAVSGKVQSWISKIPG